MTRFAHRIPFFRLFLALAAGIFTGSLCEIPAWVCILLLSLAVAALVGSSIIKKVSIQFRFRWLFGSGVLLAFYVLGAWSFQQSQTKVSFALDGVKGVFEVEVKEAPIEKAKSTLYKVNILRCLKVNEFVDVDKVALLYLPKDTSGARFDFGDCLMVYTSFSVPKGNGNPEEFQFGRYLQMHGVSATAFAFRGSYRKIGHSSEFSLKAISSHLRQKLLEVYKRYHIEGDEFAVVGALMLGYNDALTRELLDSYSITGAMHVLSVSGLHVAIVCAVFYFLLGFMDKRRWSFVLKHLIVIVLLWAFAVLTGLAPAVVRSALMFTLIALGYVVAKKPQIYNTIFFSAFVMLLYDPTYLFDVGFQLSYLAVLSIVYFEPKFKKLIDVKFKPLKWLWELTCVSVAAQLGTAALGVFYFHRFSNFFWLSNMVVVPLSGFIMYAAMALLLVTPFPGIAGWVALALKWMLIGMNSAIRWIEHLPYAAYNMWVDKWQLVVALLCVLFTSAYFVSRKYLMLQFALACVVLFLTDDLVRTYQSGQMKELIVWADNKNTHVQFTEGSRSFAVSSDSLKLKQLSSGYRIKQGIEEERFSNQKAVAFCGKHFLITNDSLFRRKYSASKMPVDYLIVGNRTRITMDKLLRFIEPKQVIVDNSISKWYSNRLRQQCDSLGIAFIDTKISGAFRLRME
jgi:ComEC/Rec2-related protein